VAVAPQHCNKVTIDYVLASFLNRALVTGHQYDLPFLVEQWDDADQHAEELIALVGDYRLARAAFEEAVRPHHHASAENQIAGGQPDTNEMTRIYISENGEDKNDGLTRETAVYSWERAAKLCDGNSGVDVSEASVQRLNAEVVRRRRSDRHNKKAKAPLS
jgi:hypothetical protein